MNLALATVADRTLSPAEQASWVEQVRAVCRASTLVRPKTPSGMDMRVKVSAAGRFGWVGDGAYRYSESDATGKPWPYMPPEWVALADEVAGEHPWDCAIINWYDPSAFLGWHQDLSERDHSLPIVTVSLGDACSWAVKMGDTDPPHRAKLESGQVTILAGPHRMAFHTVERIIPAPMFSPLTDRGRVSVTLRVAG